MTDSHAYSIPAGVVSVKIQLQTSDDKYRVLSGGAAINLSGSSLQIMLAAAV